MCPLRLLIALLFISVVGFAADERRIRENADFGWSFFKGDAPGAEQPGFNDAGWRLLNLPHDWSIESAYDEHATTTGRGGYVDTGVGWYRKTFSVPQTLQGRKISIEFDGVYRASDVWLNGQQVGTWASGYTSFACDLTPYLKFGGEHNVLAVRVDNSRQPNSRWYSGSGIYRHVWLIATNPVHVAQGGTYVTTPNVSAEAATVRVRTRLVNETATAAPVALLSEIVDETGTVCGSARVEASVRVGEQEFAQEIELPTPRRWSTRTPHLYRLRTTVEKAGVVLDNYETSFGVRSIVYDVNRGLLLNGEPVKFLGMCLHHDAGAVGAAVPEPLLEHRLRTLQAMGCNAIRTSHNPMAPEFYDLCDRLGLLVMDEAFDEWTHSKLAGGGGYAFYFAEWSERDLVAMLRRDRNHPSVVLWSVGNEILEQDAPEGPDIVRRLVAICHREDASRPVTAALDRIFTDKGPAPTAFTDLLDIVGYNYVDRWLDRRETYFGPDRSLYPARRFIGTEDHGSGGVRGVYPFAAIPEGTPERAMYPSSTLRVEQLWKFALTHDYVLGHFLWTGIDYLGEARWPAKGSTSGVLDTCGFPKDSYYLYQSIFTTTPMLHLLPHWNWAGREGQVIPLLAYTNCDLVELTLNGRSLGAKAREFPRAGTSGGWNTYAKPQVFPATADLHLAWDVPFEPGVLKAVGWKDGQKVCETEVRTAGAPVALQLSLDRDTLRADARDVARVTVSVVDEHGLVVPGAAPLVKFQVEGAGKLIGVDNGDQSSHESFQASERHAFNGLALAVIQSSTTAGEAQFTATAEGLKSASVVLRTTFVSLPKPQIAE